MSSATAPRARRIPRWLARAPIPLFRLGLGGLFGGRLVMVEHLGRRSGRVRQVVLEAVSARREGGSPTVHVVAGYGHHAQWLRNVEAEPHAPAARPGLGERRRQAARRGDHTRTAMSSVHPGPWAWDT